MATGTSARIAKWSLILKTAHISFVITKRCDEDDPERSDYAELWVKEDDVDKSRSAIRSKDDPDKLLLW